MVVNTAGYDEVFDPTDTGGAVYMKTISPEGATGTRSFNVPVGFNCEYINLSLRAAAAPAVDTTLCVSLGHRLSTRPAIFSPGIAR
jgi:hypothetical protein